MFTMCDAALNACWETTTARRHWTEQWRHGQAWRHPLYYTEPNLSIFLKRDLINNDSCFCSHILWAIDLQCHVFPFEKLLLNVSLCLIAFLMTSYLTSSPHNDVAVLGKFSNGLVCWSVRMICAKNYKTVSKFVEVMPRILWPLFFTDTV